MSEKSGESVTVPVPALKEAQTNETTSQKPQTKVYKRRWLILAIFVIYSTSNALQWIQYSIITNIVTKYYDVSTAWVDWTSMIFMITYIPLIFPASWILDRWGLKTACMIGATGTCVGAWVKVVSAARDRFYVTFIGQTIVACSQVFILSVPARLAAVWFGPDQVSSACSIGVFGNQLGVAIGFLFPPMMVKNHDNVDKIGNDLQFMYYVVAGLATFVFISIVTVFKAAPPLPPSPAQAVQRSSSQGSFFQSVKKLFFNKGYVLLLISYGINVGVFYAISTLLNQIVLVYFPGNEEDAGRIGLTIVVAGMAGSVCCGIALDKTHRFKQVTLTVYLFALISMVIYTTTLDSGYIVVVYLTGGLLGFFMTGYLPVGFEFAAELTYPEPEGTSAGLLNASSQVFGILFTTFYSTLFTKYGDLPANAALCVALFLGTILTYLIPPDLRRQKAHAKSYIASLAKEKF